jgi:hypothetical protein
MIYMKSFEGEDMQKELFPMRAFEVTFRGLDLLGVPPGKGELKVRIITREQEKEEIAEEARNQYPDQIPEDAHYSLKELPSIDPFTWKP